MIPVGSYVTGTVTEVKRPSRAKGPAELYVRFETLTLPNGVTRHFNARMGGMDGTVDAKVDRAEGKVTADAKQVRRRPHGGRDRRNRRFGRGHRRVGLRMRR